MSVLDTIPAFEEDWIKKFDPQKRILTGRSYGLAKRAMDLLLVVSTLPFWLTICGVVGLIIRFTSPGAPVVFSQSRTGKGGRRFSMFKFRTMVPNAEELKEKYAHLNELQWPDFKITDDPRVTSIGSFLRKTSLDELPQFVNVLRGEMSLVGPRAERPELMEMFQRHVPFYRARLLVKPGITGWAQINFGYASTIDETVTKLEYDLYYIKHRNLLMDLMVLIRTPATMLGFRGQ